MKIVTVIGARPQFIKAAAVSRAIAEYNAAAQDQYPSIYEVIIHTGQHFDENMSDIFFDEMQIPRPDYHLEINSLGHGAMTGRMLEKIEEVLINEKPDWVLVYGDTNSTLAGALAAKKLHIKVAHVEAGLRSYNMGMPEEINRILTDRISDLLFCPTDTAVKNLEREGFGTFPCCIIKSGDVMQDAALFYRETAARKSDIISRLNLSAKPFALCTIHRAENTDVPERLATIVNALNDITEEMDVILPIHPRTRKIMEAKMLDTKCIIIDPVGYLDMIQLLEHTRIVLTDSGGLQKEAFFFCKPCVTLRDETEWVELVEGGHNTLAGANKLDICSAFLKMRSASPNFDRNLYGAGQAASRIINELFRLQ
ncbi:MAG: UDP-N-acetylglucosamine 2-epimerase (non-hydrolyzing) [Geobacteraceae bacterium]|nr:UDP-N-acetylglucosamine 2-epimerase (non-hydrolyzing) [Geobacteraceae bacterium]